MRSPMVVVVWSIEHVGTLVQCVSVAAGVLIARGHIITARLSAGVLIARGHISTVCLSAGILVARGHISTVCLSASVHNTWVH